MRILLFSDSRRVFEKTNEIIQSKFELMWYKYDDLQKGQYPLADVVLYILIRIEFKMRLYR